MSSTELKAKLHQLIDDFEDEDYLQEVYELLHAHKGSSPDDWWDELTPEQKAGLKESEADFAAGRFSTHQEVMKEARKWASK